MITAIRRLLGKDTPFKATDVSPPRAMRTVVLSELNFNELMAELDAAKLLAHKRRSLLEDSVKPYASSAAEAQIQNAIRRHLRETRNA